MGSKEWEPRVFERAGSQHGVIIRAQLRELEVPQAAIDSRVYRKKWLRLFHEVYQVQLDADPYLARVHGLTLKTQGLASKRCAARLFGMDGFDECDLIEVDTELDFRPSGVLLHRTLLPPGELRTLRDGIPVTQPQWTLLDLGSVCRRNEVEWALDFCLRRRWTTWDALRELVARYGGHGYEGAAILRELLELRAPQFQHTDSLLETLALQVTRDAGLPTPLLQFPLRRNGDVIARADLAYPKQRVLIETHGDKFHRAKRWQLTRDCRRENAIALLRDYTVLKYSWDMVTKEPAEMAAEIAQHLGIQVQLDLDLRRRLVPYSPRYALRTSGLANSSLPGPLITTSPVSNT